jgi:hypothetical protein
MWGRATGHCFGSDGNGTLLPTLAWRQRSSTTLRAGTGEPPEALREEETIHQNGTRIRAGLRFASAAQFGKKRCGFPQIRYIEALAEPAVYGGEKVPRLDVVSHSAQ